MQLCWVKVHLDKPKHYCLHCVVSRKLFFHQAISLSSSFAQACFSCKFVMYFSYFFIVYFFTSLVTATSSPFQLSVFRLRTQLHHTQSCIIHRCSGMRICHRPTLITQHQLYDFVYENKLTNLIHKSFLHVSI